jgi:hypothetical protein
MIIYFKKFRPISEALRSKYCSKRPQRTSVDVHVCPFRKHFEDAQQLEQMLSHDEQVVLRAIMISIQKN